MAQEKQRIRCPNPKCRKVIQFSVTPSQYGDDRRIQCRGCKILFETKVLDTEEVKFWVDKFGTTANYALEQSSEHQQAILALKNAGVDIRNTGLCFSLESRIKILPPRKVKAGKVVKGTFNPQDKKALKEMNVTLT